LRGNSSRFPSGWSIAVGRHDGKEAKRMARKPTERRKGDATGGNGATPAGPKTVKVTFHLTVETAQRLGIESAMRRVSQSAIAESVLASYLSRWQLPTARDPGGAGAA
jgi:hypothetical protein